MLRVAHIADAVAAVMPTACDMDNANARNETAPQDLKHDAHYGPRHRQELFILVHSRAIDPNSVVTLVVNHSLRRVRRTTERVAGRQKLQLQRLITCPQQAVLFCLQGVHASTSSSLPRINID